METKIYIRECGGGPVGQTKEEEVEGEGETKKEVEGW